METNKNQNRRITIRLSIILGLVLGTFLFPMIIIPLMAAAVVIGALYLLFREIIRARIKNKKNL